MEIIKLNCNHSISLTNEIIATIGEFEKQPNGNEYDEIYVVHVKPCTMKSKFHQYDLSDLSGLDVIQ